MITTIVTMLYGPILPILYPIAWLSLFVLYTMERLKLYYSYQKPNYQSYIISLKSLKKIKRYSLIFFFMTGILALSNQRLFNNYIPEKIIKDENRQWWAFSNLEKEENPTIRLIQRWKHGASTPLIVFLTMFIFF
jgi:hypothetical protein